MSGRYHQHKEEVHEQFKLGDVLTSHHLDCMQTRGHPYEVVPAYTGQRWKGFLNPNYPQRKGRKPPPDRPGHPHQLKQWTLMKWRGLPD